MSMEYYIDVECELKKQMPMESLLEYQKKKVYFDTMIELMKQHQPDKDPMSATFMKKTGGVGEESEAQEVKMTDLKKETEWMEAWEPYCGNCGLAIVSSPNDKGILRCSGMVNYPISMNAEGLLGITMNAVAGIEKRAPPRLLLEYIIENKVTADPVKGMRA